MTASDGGKGSGRRPMTVSDQDYANRWNAIFGRDQAPVEPARYEPTIEEAIKALENSNMDAAWHILRRVKDQAPYWRQRALQAEAELHAARGQR
jgi:hypothetical protein